eukprot:2659808-Amphidinium_carterae.1
MRDWVVDFAPALVDADHKTFVTLLASANSGDPILVFARQHFVVAQVTCSWAGYSWGLCNPLDWPCIGGARHTRHAPAASSHDSVVIAYHGTFGHASRSCFMHT